MPRSPEAAAAKMPQTEKFKQSSRERRQKLDEQSLASVEAAIASLGKQGKKYETSPVDLPIADMNIPNAFLLWEKASGALKNNPAAFESLSNTQYATIRDRATAYCYMAAEIVREERALDNLDRSDPDYSKKFMAFWEKKSKFVNFSNAAGIDFSGHMNKDGLNPENLSPENATAEGRKAHETLPSADEIIRELSRHMDDRADSYNKYLFMVSNYAKAARLGDSTAMANAERVWKQYDEDLQLDHGMMKTIAFEWVKENS